MTKRRMAMCVLLALLLTLGTPLNAVAAGAGGQARPGAQPVDPALLQENRPAGLVGFEGDWALTGDGGQVSVIIELKHQPPELERLAAQQGRAGMAAGDLEQAAAQDQQDLRAALDSLAGGAGPGSRSPGGYEITATYSLALNGVAVTLPESYLDDLAALDCVYAIYPNETIQLDLEQPEELGQGGGQAAAYADGDSSVQAGMADSRAFFNVEGLHNAGHTGDGVTVGVIDTGIDYEHPDLKDAFANTLPNGQAPEPKELLNGKFYGRNYIEGNGHGANDPMDDQGHGTHVSGTIAGRGVNMPVSTLGIAPDATLVAYKVINDKNSVSSSNLISAMEDAVKDGCTILNMSLGWSNANGALHATTLAINNLALQNPEVLFVVCAGNSGPRANTLWSPSTSPLVLTVANAQIPSPDKLLTVHHVANNADDQYDVGLRLIRSEWENKVVINEHGSYTLTGSQLKPDDQGHYRMVLLPEVAKEPTPAAEEPIPAAEEGIAAGSEPAPEAEETAPEAEDPAPDAEETAPEAEVPAPDAEETAPDQEEGAAASAQLGTAAGDEPAPKLGTGTAAEFDAFAKDNKELLAGSIVVLERGQNFDLTVARLKKLGGGAILVINTEARKDEYENISWYQGPYQDYLPVFTLQYDEGETLLHGMIPGNAYDVKIVKSEALGGEAHVYSGSSRGPVVSTDDLKPDITAPGTSVLSSVPPFYAGVDNHDYSYASMTGTSMATPHVVGFAALLKEKHADWNALELKAHLMNTAQPLPDASVYDMGAGMVDPQAALDNSDVYVTAENGNAYFRNETGALVSSPSQTGSLSFGPMAVGQAGEKSITITVYSANDREFAINVVTTGTALTDAGITVAPEQDSVSVTDDQPARIKVTANVPASADQSRAYEGFVELTDQSSGLTLTLPFALYLRQGQSSGGSAYHPEFTFIQAAAISTGDKRHVTSVQSYTSSDSMVHYRFAKTTFDMFECLIADSQGKVLGPVDGRSYTDTGKGDWYWTELLYGKYLPYTYDQDGKVTGMASEQVLMREGAYQFILHPCSISGQEDEFAMPFYVDNTLPELTLDHYIQDDGVWRFRTEGENLVLTGKIFDQGTEQMKAAGVNSAVNERIFGRSTSQQDNILVLRMDGVDYRASVQADGSFQVIIPASVKLSPATIYYGDHFLPVGIEADEWGDNAVAGFSPEKLCYKLAKTDASVPWMNYYAFRAANLDSLEVKLEKVPSSSGGGSGSVVTPGQDSGSDQPAVENGQASLEPKATVSGGEAKVTVSESQLKALAQQSGLEQVVIAPAGIGDADQVGVQLPKAALSDLSAKSSADVRIETPLVTATLPHQALADLAQGSGALTVQAGRTADGAVTVRVQSDGKDVAQISGGLPVELPAAQAGPGTVAVLVLEDGTEKLLTKSVALDGAVYATLPGTATVKVVQAGKSFGDTEEHWSKDAVAFVSARGLFNGQSAEEFAPNAQMNRGMLVTVLNRLEDQAKAGAAAQFSDVAAGAYYADAAAWSMEKGIVTGVGQGQFAPETPITREQLATMLYRYAGIFGYDVTASGDLTAFGDGDGTSQWAQDAMRWAVGSGLIGGKGQGVLDPSGSATRAEVAVILQRFVESIAK